MKSQKILTRAILNFSLCCLLCLIPKLTQGGIVATAVIAPDSSPMPGLDEVLGSHSVTLKVRIAGKEVSAWITVQINEIDLPFTYSAVNRTFPALDASVRFSIENGALTDKESEFALSEVKNKFNQFLSERNLILRQVENSSGKYYFYEDIVKVFRGPRDEFDTFLYISRGSPSLRSFIDNFSTGFANETIYISAIRNLKLGDTYTFDAKLSPESNLEKELMVEYGSGELNRAIAQNVDLNIFKALDVLQSIGWPVNNDRIWLNPKDKTATIKRFLVLIDGRPVAYTFDVQTQQLKFHGAGFFSPAEEATYINPDLHALKYYGVFSFGEEKNIDELQIWIPKPNPETTILSEWGPDRTRWLEVVHWDPSVAWNAKEDIYDDETTTNNRKNLKMRVIYAQLEPPNSSVDYRTFNVSFLVEHPNGQVELRNQQIAIKNNSSRQLQLPLKRKKGNSPELSQHSAIQLSKLFGVGSQEVIARTTQKSPLAQKQGIDRAFACMNLF